MTGTAVGRLAAAWPTGVDPDPAFERALAHLGWSADAETTERAARSVAVVVAVVAVGVGVGVATLGSGRIGLAILAAGTGVGVCVPTVVERGVRFLATLRRTRALGSAAALVGRAALRLRIDPATERAAVFAARTGSGVLARSLHRHVDRARGTPRSGFEAFVDEWGDQFPALERAVDRLDAAASAPATERDRHLDRAVAAALDGAREELATFATEIRGPVTGLYAFGVLLPLALVGVLPAARATGVRLSLPVVVALYDLALPLVVVVAGAWLLARRPVAFPPPRIGRDHPDTPDGWSRSVAAGVVAAAVGVVVVTHVVGGWAGPVAAVGLGPGVALVVHVHEARRVRERVIAVESELHDALYLVGRRVSAGEAVETAVDGVADRMSGATGDLLEEATERQHRLGVTVAEAFRGEHGVLGTLPSRRANEMAELFGLAATEGRPAGDALVATAEHAEELRRIERDARRELAQVTGTLSNTAAVFGPLVGGATVALSARVGRTETAGFGAGALPTGELGVAVGAYVLWLAVALTVLSTGLTRGLDRTHLGHRIGVALCLATCCYFSAYVGAGLFL
ncbi:type II secretion system protein [Haloplanus salilacus]|uniref:type II secretion system F family protein n=1 Tax=Haloplanus salilacus TaxID=2949994 RepID=UPI0030D29FDE